MFDAIKDLSKFVLERTGWILTDSELTRLYNKYFDEQSRTLNLKKLVDDLRKAVLTQQTSALFLNNDDDNTSISSSRPSSSSSMTSPYRTTGSFAANTNTHNTASLAATATGLPSPCKTESGAYGSTEFGNTSKQKKSSRPSMNYHQIMEILARQMSQRINLLKGDNKLKKAYLLISESRSPVINRNQLKIALQTRLGIHLKDVEIEELFLHLDPMCDGTINIRQFINMIMKSEREYVTLSLQLNRDRDDEANDNGEGKKTNNKSSKQLNMNDTNTMSATTFASNTPTAVSGLPAGSDSNNNHHDRPMTSNGNKNTKLSRTNSSKNQNNKSTPSVVKGNQWDHNENAVITYDKMIVGLQPPTPAFCRPYSIEETESFIWERVFERSNLSDNMIKTLIRLFSDGESHQSSHSQVITLDQLRYTLWKRLKMNINDGDVLKFFEKYANKNAKNYGLSIDKQVIDMFDFVDGIIRNRNTSKPFLEDRSSAAGGSGLGERGGGAADKLKFTRVLLKSRYLEEFLVLVRQQLNELTNRESRAPHYLLHHNDRMTLEQAKDFFASKLNIHFDKLPVAMQQDVLQEYVDSNLLDIKRIIMDAMTVKEDKVRSMGDAVGVLSSQTLANGAAVSVDAMPTSLKKFVWTPQRIEEMIVHKCEERQKTDHPHATLYKLFRENVVGNDSNNGVSGSITHSNSLGTNRDNQHCITRKGMKSVLHRFDILVTTEEFEAFYLKHANADGMIDVHQFLRRLMPPPSLDHNPFTPKDPMTIKQQQALASAVEELTGKRRDVSALNGPSFTRIDTKFLQSMEGNQQQGEDEDAHLQMDMESEEISSGIRGYGGDIESKSPTEQHAHHHKNWQSTNGFPVSPSPMSVNVTIKSPASSRPSSSTNPSPSMHARKNKMVASSSNAANVKESPRPASPRPSSPRGSGPSHKKMEATTSTPGKSSSVQTFNEQFYSGNFNITQSQVNEESKSAPQRVTTSGDGMAEKKMIAESLIHAMRDLPNLPLSSPPGVKGQTNATNEEDEQYKLMQSQHLMALAQAYAQSVNITPKSPMTTGNSSPRSKQTSTSASASPRPPSATGQSRSNQNLSSTLKQFEFTETGMRPAATPDPHVLHSPRDTSPRGDRRFTDSGQKKHAHVNPFNHRLLKMYKYTGRQVTTTHEEYGGFLKNLNHAIAKRRNLYEKQEEELKLTGKKM